MTVIVPKEEDADLKKLREHYLSTFLASKHRLRIPVGEVIRNVVTGEEGTFTGMLLLSWPGYYVCEKADGSRLKVWVPYAAWSKYNPPPPPFSCTHCAGCDDIEGGFCAVCGRDLYIPPGG